MVQKEYSFVEEALPYELEELQSWQKNDDNCINILLKSNAPLSIKRIVCYKKGFVIDKNGDCLGRRKDKPTPRRTMHFDVAKVVVNNIVNIKFGWYGSYDWLTSPNWIASPSAFLPTSTDAFSKEFEKIFQKALFEYIGITKLKQLQDRAKRLPNVAEPDLWFIKNDYTFQFIEAKIGGTKVADSQVAGLALLKKALGADVKIVRLHQSDKKVKLNNFTKQFFFFCDLLS